MVNCVTRHNPLRVRLDSRAMRRWVIALLLFVVPFQIVWGAAAPFCAHEAGASAKTHFGHHVHEHQAGGETGSAADDAGDTSGGFHADCESCHLGCSAFLPALPSALGAPPHGDAMGQPEPRYDSHIPDSPLRPDRALATPAPRFGGDVAVVSLAD